MLILIALAAISLVPLCIIGSHIVEMVREWREARAERRMDAIRWAEYKAAHYVPRRLRH